MTFTYKTKDGFWHVHEIPDGDEHLQERLDFIDYLETSPDVKSWH